MEDIRSALNIYKPYKSDSWKLKLSCESFDDGFNKTFYNDEQIMELLGFNIEEYSELFKKYKGKKDAMFGFQIYDIDHMLELRDFLRKDLNELIFLSVIQNGRNELLLPKFDEPNSSFVEAEAAYLSDVAPISDDDIPMMNEDFSIADDDMPF